ncbi:aspartate--tRNA ligase [Candidatus Woesearchaeota archaeon]|nr:aspartate--tRNA ligase [Candidatus Woesearchaeota archaeon]
MKRTHTCGELTKKDLQKEAVLCGWVYTRRDHGGKIFIDLRDRYGITQVVLDPSHNKQAHEAAQHLGREWVVQVTGHIRLRPEGMTNPNLKTGEIELLTDSLQVLSQAETPPFEIDDRNLPSEELRLTHRYLDLRRPTMQQRLLTRHKAAQAAREYLTSQNFMEIETPILVRTTPGGARVFKTPSRVHPGKFFALPESPQTYKQLLMIAGFDRYFQLPKCLRDEDLRADRQPEFTQIDLEMSFIDEKDVQDIIEGMLKQIFKKTLNTEIQTPFPRITYHEAMSKYGSDKPDLRFGLEFIDVTDIVKHSDFNVFKATADKKGKIFCLKVPGGAKFTRTEIDQLTEIAKLYKLPGVAWIKITGKNVMEGTIVKFLQQNIQAQLTTATNAEENDLLVFAAEQFEKAANALGQVRLHIAQKLGLITNEYKFCWITDFPLYEWNEETGNWQAKHHIFTSPKEEDMNKLETSPGEVRAKAYDVVLNGVELGGGSIRIHNKETQTRVCKVIGLEYEEVEKTFDFLLKAFKFGVPPHGGIALGFDRLVALMCGLNDIREVIAFPRDKATTNPMDGSPQEWTPEFLKELHLKLDIVKKQ